MNQRSSESVLRERMIKNCENHALVFLCKYLQVVILRKSMTFPSDITSKLFDLAKFPVQVTYLLSICVRAQYL